MNERKHPSITKPERDRLLEEAMKLYGNDIYYIVFSYMKDHALAEDLTQEVFVKFYNKMEYFRNESALKSWIISIAVNHCKDYLKRWDTRMIGITHLISDLVKGSLGTPEQELISKETNSELIKNVLSLPLKYREIIFLFYFEEMKLVEIAECLEMKLSTVKTRLTKGRKLLGTTVKSEEVYVNG